MTKNVAKVPLKQWNKWGESARLVFNRVYLAMAGDQEMYLHPQATPRKQAHWHTTAYNAAWTAADAAQESTGRFVKKISGSLLRA